MERAKGPFMRVQPLGRRTSSEAKSFRFALKCPAPPETEMVHSKRNEAFGRAVLDRASRSSILHELSNILYTVKV